MKYFWKTLSILLIVFCVTVFSACGNAKIPNPTPENVTYDQTFSYEYNYATDNDFVESVELKTDTLDTTQLIVPVRDEYNFAGWYADWLFTTQVSDGQGNFVIGNEIFTTGSTQLFAKWVAVDQPTYRILMVYVTQVQASLETNAGTFIDINYTMSDTEHQICELISTMFSEYLNALINGLVNFQVDTYFTTDVIGNDSFTLGFTGTEQFRDYKIYAENISELNGKLDGYKSTITTFCMNDYTYNSQLSASAGSAGVEEASIGLEFITLPFIMNKDMDIASIFDFSDPGIVLGWQSIMELYLHEFTHTVELQPYVLEHNTIDYHGVISYYGNAYGSISSGLGIGQPGISGIEITRLYLLDQAIINGEPAGIPNSFWYQ